MLYFFFLALIFPLSPSASAAGLTGGWDLASTRACSTDAPYEDAFFALYVKNFQWTFVGQSELVETITMLDPEENFKCEAEITYSIEYFPRAIDGTPLGFMDQLQLERTRFRTNCLQPDVRPRLIDLHYLAYPEFLETYEFMHEAYGPCPAGQSVITQFRKR